MGTAAFPGELSRDDLVDDGEIRLDAEYLRVQGDVTLRLPIETE